jgi:hypothetical protein
MAVMDMTALTTNPNTLSMIAPKIAVLNSFFSFAYVDILHAIFQKQQKGDP